MQRPRALVKLPVDKPIDLKLRPYDVEILGRVITCQGSQTTSNGSLATGRNPMVGALQAFLASNNASFPVRI